MGQRCLQPVFLLAFTLRHLVNHFLQPLPPLGKPEHYIPDFPSDTRTVRHADCNKELLASHWLEKSLNV